MADWVDVAPAEEFRPGERRSVDLGGTDLLVFNLDGTFYAIEDICTHDYAELEDAELEGEEIICPRHGARFNVRSGEVLSPPAYEDIATFPVRVEEGVVQVREDRDD